METESLSASDAEAGTQEMTETDPETDTEELSASGIWVHVCGQVQCPGVYELPEGSRVWEAVEAAGGFTDEADPEAVNLAAPAADGTKVTIPSKEETALGWTEPQISDNSQSGIREGITGTGLVDINRADLTQLMTLPGIGQAKAEAVIAYREQYGSFQVIEDIMKVTGIKDGLFARIRDYITVGG